MAGAKIPAPVTNPGMTAESPTPLLAYSTRKPALAPAGPHFAAAYGTP